MNINITTPQLGAKVLTGRLEWEAPYPIAKEYSSERWEDYLRITQCVLSGETDDELGDMWILDRCVQPDENRIQISLGQTRRFNNILLLLHGNMEYGYNYYFYSVGVSRDQFTWEKVVKDRVLVDDFDRSNWREFDFGAVDVQN